jgi:RNA polymerase sigma-70 factor (ECF subfamily)
MKPVKGNEVTRLECDPLFPQTQWSLIQRAQDDSTEALNSLCGKYRRPFLIWLQGRQRELHGLEPEDLINGFLGLKFQHYVLKAVNPDKGKFRSFVRTCLNNYVRDEVARRMAAVRGGGMLHQPVEELDEQGRTLVDLVSTEASADEAFDRAWGLAILNNAIRRLEHELSQKGSAHLDLWKRLEPLLYEEADAPGYDDISRQLGTTKPILHTAACRIRKRLNALIREEVSETVANKQDFEEELRRFITLFSASSRAGEVA